MKIKRLTANTLVARMLGWLAQAVARYRGWLVYPQVLLFLACLWYTGRNLTLDTSRTNLVGRNQKYLQSLQALKSEFPNQDDLVVIVESENHDKNRRFVERLGARLEAETNLFRDVLFKGDLKMLGSKALLFLSEPDLAQLKKTLTDSRPWIEQVSRATNLVSLFDMVNRQFRTATREANAENRSLVQGFAALERILTEAAENLSEPSGALPPGLHALLSTAGGNGAERSGQSAALESEQRSYITLAHGTIYLVTARALRVSMNGEAVQRLRGLIEQTKTEVPGVNVGLTGEIVLEHDEMAQSQRDTELASVVALLVCALIFVYGYQETGRPIKATLCLLVGVGYTLAFATWSVGHLNVLTVTFVPILIGLAIDYGVHLISRYEEELRRGNTELGALTQSMVYTGQGILTGALTTAGAFWAMTLTHFRGIQEMGIICGGGLLVCLLPMLTMLPALLLSGRQNLIDHAAANRVEPRARFEQVWLQRPGLVIGLTLAACVLGATQIPKVYFDYNLLHMQSAGLPAVQLEKKLLDTANKSLLFGAVLATNEADAARLVQALTNLPAVASVESVAGHVSGDQRRKLQGVREIKAGLASIWFAPTDPRPVDLSELSQTLYSLYGYLGAAHAEVQGHDPGLASQLSSLRRAVNGLHKAMFQGTAQQLTSHSLKLAAFQQALLNDLRQTFQVLQDQDCDSPLRGQDLPPPIRHRFIGVTGKYLLMVYPKQDLRNRRNQRDFIQQVQAVYPNLSGTPVQLYYYTELLKNSYEQAAKYALGAIALLVLMHFRSLLCLVLALVPVAVGSLWLGGIIGFFGVPLNPANIMTLPLVIGIGVTNGIQVLNRFAEEQTPAILARSTGKAVLVSALTSMAGFGSLILAKHQGIQSLGYVMTCGLGTCMVAGLTFLPALLSFLMVRPGRRDGSALQQRPDNRQGDIRPAPSM